MTPCHSIAFDTTYEGTTLLVQQKENGYEFAIKTPCRAVRWEKYDKELAAAWKRIVRLALTRTDDSFLEPFLRAMYDMTFYWYNFMPLSRGTAAGGFVLMMALLASVGLRLNKHVPKGMQTDWEAILCEFPKDFEDVMYGWMQGAFVPFDVDAVPPVAEALPTTRAVVVAFNYCPSIETD